MSHKYKDEDGQWWYVRLDGRRERYYERTCECGTTDIVDKNWLKSKCRPCTQRQVVSDGRMYTVPKTHGGSYTRLYKTWESMKARCYNPNNAGYEWYMKKGIEVCDKWINSFSAFKEWALENGYTDSLCIDRIDSDGNYEPDNCQFITNAENVRKSNKRSRILV